MRKNYEKMFELLVEKKVFKKGEVINRDLFEKRLIELDLVEELDKRYNYGRLVFMDYYVYRFSDRFKSFMMSNKNYSKYLGNGKYEIL